MRPTAFLLLGGAIAAPALPSPAGARTGAHDHDPAARRSPNITGPMSRSGSSRSAAARRARWRSGTTSRRRGNEPGTKWLADLRAWWRKGGRSMTLPADGVSGATRAPGQYTHSRCPPTSSPASMS